MFLINFESLENAIFIDCRASIHEPASIFCLYQYLQFAFYKTENILEVSSLTC